MIRRVVLVGLSGTGKSTLARRIADELTWDVVDTDIEIERRMTATIPQLFWELGEAGFRRIEREVLISSLVQDRVIIATGGGAVIEDDVWSSELLGHPESLVVWLDGDPETLVDRLNRQAASDDTNSTRPLLTGGDLLQTLVAMRSSRGRAYARADVILTVDQRSPDALAVDVGELVRLDRHETSTVLLRTGNHVSTISVGDTAISALPDLVRTEWPTARTVWIAVDEHVLPHIKAALAAFQDQGHTRYCVTDILSGESSKSLGGLSRLFDWMLDGGIERGDVVVAVGGGVVGDLVGFAAASVLRGVGLVQIPTTLLSMVDSSVGGKTGINHPAGKNLIGAFYQPRHVMIDAHMLRTLPQRELCSGWAEVIKHAVIEPSTPGGESNGLMSILERNSDALTRRVSPLLSWVIRKNVTLKAAVVTVDEREAGTRAFLNFGHTIGHAVEVAGSTLLHGEAVSLGMCAASWVARQLNLVDDRFAARLQSLLQTYGLPTEATFDRELARQRMFSDKKRSAGVQRWVLPVNAGGVVIRSDVPDWLVDDAIESVYVPSR